MFRSRTDFTPLLRGFGSEVVKLWFGGCNELMIVCGARHWCKAFSVVGNYLGGKRNNLSSAVVVLCCGCSVDVSEARQPCADSDGCGGDKEQSPRERVSWETTCGEEACVCANGERVCVGYGIGSW